MRIDNLLEKRWSRNATLVQGLVALDIIEELGCGLDRMVAAMVDAGLPAPVFSDTGGTFVVTLYGHGQRLLASADGPRQQERAAAMDRGARPLNDRQVWALDYLRTTGPLTARTYADALGMSPVTALRNLRDLVARGLVEATGTTNDRRYRLTLDGGDQ